MCEKGKGGKIKEEQGGVDSTSCGSVAGLFCSVNDLKNVKNSVRFSVNLTETKLTSQIFYCEVIQKNLLSPLLNFSSPYTL